MSKNMIYHVPYPLGLKTNAASSIRPQQMLEAFRKSGFNVTVVSGYVAERKLAIRAIKSEISEGKIFDFLYSESSTMPTPLTEKDHLPRAPLMDYLFFYYCKKRGIKISLFYRDIYWRFPNYGKHLTIFKKVLALSFYYFELLMYKFTLNTMYLPSLAMAKHIPFIPQKKFRDLPPGTALVKAQPETVELVDNKLRLFFVGGVGHNYQMHELFSAVYETAGVELIFCTPEEQWEEFKHEYIGFLGSNIKIVHEAGDELSTIYESIDITMLFVKQHKYWDFAVPVKIFEYMGHGKPVIGSKGGQIEKIISQYSAGWCVEYSSEALQDLFRFLKLNKHQIENISNNLGAKHSDFSWDNRAKQVIDVLSKCKS